MRIEALSGDIKKIRQLGELDRARLEIEQVTKVNPRLILHNVSAGMSKNIKSDLVALNLDKQKDSDVEVIYIFPPKNKRTFVSCMIEVSPNIRTKLMQNSHVYINYSACRIEDYVRILQCYKFDIRSPLGELHCSFSLWSLRERSRNEKLSEQESACGKMAQGRSPTLGVKRQSLSYLKA